MATMAFQVHARSISLPSRLHPAGSLVVEDRLNRLTTALESSPVSLSSVKGRLVALADIIVSLNDLIQSQQSSLSRYDGGRVVEDALDSSVSLISTCSTCRDIVSSLKDHVTDIQSALRRRSSADITAHVAAYVTFRKASKKEICKMIRELKQIAPRSGDLHLSVIVRVIGEVVSAAIAVFQSLLVFLSLPLIRSSKWSMVSRLVRSSSSSSINGDDFLNEIGAVDVAVFSYRRNGGNGDLEGKLRAVDLGSQELETALHHLFRCFVQNRVTLLNILTTAH